MEKFARALIAEGVTINSYDARGFSICASGSWYLYSDGIVMNGTGHENDYAYAFWPTAEEAEWFYDDWKGKQGVTPQPKECGCGDLRREIEDLKETVSDYEESHRKIIAEECAGDEKHCTCVPALRQRVAELEAELKYVARNASMIQAERIELLLNKGTVSGPALTQGEEK